MTVFMPAPTGSEPGVQVTPGLATPHSVLMFFAKSAKVSGTTGALEVGLLQPATEPAPYDFVRLPSWPLQSMLVFDLIEQPDRLTTGAPLSESETCDFACPLSSVIMQELSAS